MFVTDGAEHQKEGEKKNTREINNQFSLTYDELDEMNVMKSLYM